jgi:KaiC/GvpD/RAD55 family RecA-like ATPase
MGSDKLQSEKLTTGIQEIDRLIGGVLPGDNLVWEVDSGAPVGRFISSFLSACEAEGSSVVYVSFNRSPQTISNTYAGLAGFDQLFCISLRRSLTFAHKYFLTII